MPEIQIPLVSGQAKDKSDADYQTMRQVNICPIAQPTEVAEGYHRFFPGLKKISDVNGLSRGAEYNVSQEKIYRVFGNKLYKDGEEVEGVTVPGSDRVAMASGENSQAVLTGGNLHIYRYDGTEKTFEYSKPLSDTCRYGKRYLSLIANSDSFIASSLEDESKPDPVAPIYRSETRADVGVAIKSMEPFLIVFGTATTEYYVRTGDADNLFIRQPSYQIRKGIVGREAVCKFQDTFAAVTSASVGMRTVSIVKPGEFVPISDYQLNKDLRKYTEAQIKKVRIESLFVHEEEKLLLTLPDKTLIYHPGTGSWSEIQSNGEMHTGVDYILRGDIVTCGDTKRAFHGQLDDTSSEQYGEDDRIVIYTTLIRAMNTVLTDVEMVSNISETSTADRMYIDYTLDGVVWQGNVPIRLNEDKVWIKRNLFDFGPIDLMVGLRFTIYGANPVTITGCKGNLQ